MLLAGDIGGTKTILALFSLAEAGEGWQPLRVETFPSRDFSSLEEMIDRFLQDGRTPLPTLASFGVAGPVEDNQAEITNLPWYINARLIQQAAGIPRVLLLNDLQAIATAVPHLTAADTAVIKPGQPDPTGAIAIVAPGTGLGEAFLIWDGTRYLPCPSEGGHAAFSPTDALQRDLLAWLEERLSHVSFERVCSGSGIPNLYNFLKEDGRYPEPAWLHDQLAQADDPTPIIVTAALNQKADICVATLNLFIDILGNECSNMAVKVLATGGLYLAGGIPPRILAQLQDGRFLHQFTDKGRFSPMMADIPIHVILNRQIGLYGAAYHGLERTSVL